MGKVAIIEAKPSRNNYSKLFEGAFEFDQYALVSDASVKKVLKRDVDIDINLEDYQWVILVGADPFKMYTGMSGIQTYTGRLIDDKFLPVINPGMIKFKPEAKKPWEESRDSIISYICEGKKLEKYDTSKFIGIRDTKEALDYVNAAIDAPGVYIALDSETSALYPRQGYPMGISLTYEEDSGAYILSDCIDEVVESRLQDLFNKKKVVFHNAKFDLAFLEYHFNWEFPDFEDTMLMHYCLDETQGSHGLKELALKHTKYGDYEREQGEWIKDYCKRTGTKKQDFSFEVIPFEIIYQYAAIDTAVTFALYKLFKKYLDKNAKLTGVYRNILIPGCRMLTDIQDNGVPFDIERLKFAQDKMNKELEEANDALRDYKEIAEFEKDQGKEFNPNSTLQLRKLLFDYIGLSPTGKLTGTGAHSTDAEVLGVLAKQHPIPAHILAVRKSGKIKNTYLDKIIPQLDRDGRLRTNFNLHTTTSGRLSSSGKLNLQQLPRDNPAVKGCIKARPGHRIVSMDQV